ncbi:YhcN/YlaJ family sporulation lipoprotein [Sporosarcina sp. G11-34]|uniref:YhcN/YlaJ family sporulation lipoprotein n=1 Tax=Sporosarcina sp. G11-34 TaxID=2849605 RepID=UPI0022A998B7|nr:YhcN/YlaJ family sporulation lipoprotein [Sporosarcina sp. G11-34]MCZ2257745.1 YhcN/YlaJ family sporulation lipoprotein [Sporosarcina sp. G11-34]
MKKVFMITTAVLLSLALIGCGANKDKGTVKNDNATTPKEVVEDKNNDVVVEEDNTTNDTVNNGNETKLEVAEDAANRVTELDEVESATVIVTDHNAYAAVMLKSGTDEAVTDELESQIADKVREANTNIENVYVSSNPDFIERMTGYGTKIKEGEPVEGFFEEFSEAVRNVFPDAH